MISLGSIRKHERTHVARRMHIAQHCGIDPPSSLHVHSYSLPLIPPKYTDPRRRSCKQLEFGGYVASGVNPVGNALKPGVYLIAEPVPVYPGRARGGREPAPWAREERRRRGIGGRCPAAARGCCALVTWSSAL